MVEKVHKLALIAQVFVLDLKKKKTNKNWRKKISLLQNIFFFFLLFGPFLLSKFITFSFFFILNDLKCYKNVALSSAYNLCTIITIEQHKRNFLGVQELVVVCCFELLTLLLWGGITFSFLIHFWQFLIPQMQQEEKFSIYLDTINKKPFPLDVDYPKRLSVLKSA
jgi:hypothetical protein